MKYRFLPQAEMDFQDAVDYYEHARAGLGAEFACEVSSAIERILQYPARVGNECQPMPDAV